LALAGQGLYPEREDAPEPAADRLLAALAFHYQNLFCRELPVLETLAADAQRLGEQYGDGPLTRHLADLRYRLRRDGARGDRVAACFGLYARAASAVGVPAPSPEAQAAAAALLEGGCVELDGSYERRQALALAAATRAIEGIPVHIITTSAFAAQRVADHLRGPFSTLGLEVACIAQPMDLRAKRAAYAAPVVCGALREIAIDYLGDRMRLGGAKRPLAGALQRIAGDIAATPPLLRGLHCALIDEADSVLLDDAHVPLAITVESDQTAERLLYEQALELARALEEPRDYQWLDEGARLSEEGAERASRIVGPVGGVWAARQRREDLIVLALDALYRLQKGPDYRVEQGRLTLVRTDEDKAAEPAEIDPNLQHLLEVKEGCRLSGRRDVLIRLSVPRFFHRYLRRSGICADARGVEREIWALYSLKTVRIGTLPARLAQSCRVFAAANTKREAVAARVQEGFAAGDAILIAMRTPAEAQALATVLENAGLQVPVIRGAGDDAEKQTIARLDSAGGVALVLCPAERRTGRAERGRVPLRLLVPELHDSARHIARLVRAFAVDSCEIMLSLEDESVARAVAQPVLVAARLKSNASGGLSPAWSEWILRFAQRGVEHAFAIARQETAAREQHLDDLLAFSGKRE